MCKELRKRGAQKLLLPSLVWGDSVIVFFGGGCSRCYHPLRRNASLAGTRFAGNTAVRGECIVHQTCAMAGAALSGQLSRDSFLSAGGP